jgi:hypothetical protein
LINVGVAFVGVREQPGLLVMIIVVSGLGYLGILLGLIGGYKMTGELRRAGLIQSQA